MMHFSEDPLVAEQEMHAIIYYLVAFGYVDGELDHSEKGFIQDHIGKLVEHRAREAMGGEVEEYRDVVTRWTTHFHEVLDQVEDQIQGYFTESVAEGETTRQFVIAKLKLRCFELFKGFDERARKLLLTTVDELMLADGTVHPNEEAFRRELFALLEAPIELHEDDVELVDAGQVVVDSTRTLSPNEPDHPFFRTFEFDYSRDPEAFAQQSKADLSLMKTFLAKLDEQRAAGRGRLGAATDFSAFAPGDRFLDGHVYVLQPEVAKSYELVVLGDLHGCYSCLKGALLQADFLRKVQAYHDDPVNKPYPGLVLLGDYIDRGRFSYTGILRTAMQLFTTVPDHVFMLRGNHEYYVEINGKVLAPVRPSEAMSSLTGVAPNDVFAAYMRLFEALPNTLVFDKMMFVHAGIPREETMADKWKGVASLNDPAIRFEMLWSDPSEAESVPAALQKDNARFPFGRQQFRHFIHKLGLRTLVRGHERVVEGFRKIYDDPDAMLFSLFSAGGATNDDLPMTSNYRQVTPMALTVRHQGGVTKVEPFAIDYATYNDPQLNAFFRDEPLAGTA
ncbi:MAG: metallophosphoesterase family protein [Polyangiaceae bacterium]